MGGSESLKGFDYQITFTLIKTLDLIKAATSCKIMFESLAEDEEDLNIIFENRKEYYQLKKRVEGNHWTPGDLKELFKNFISKSTPEIIFHFVTDGTANSDVKKLIRSLNDKLSLEDSFLKQFLPEGTALDVLKTILKRIKIHTRYFSSPYEGDPAFLLRKEVFEILSKPPFKLKQNSEKTYGGLWKIIYDYAKESKVLEINQIVLDFKKVGVELEITPWLVLPQIDDFQGREQELRSIKEKLTATRKIAINGINGIGKTWVTAKIILSESVFSKNCCWVAVSKWMSVERFLFLLTSYFYSNQNEHEARSIQASDSNDRIEVIINSLKNVEFTLVIDSLNSGNSEFVSFIADFVNKLKENEIRGYVIISTTQRNLPYDETDVFKNRFSEHNLQGFSFEDTEYTLLELNKNITKEEVFEFHRSLGGHPMSLYFLKQLISKKAISGDVITNIRTRSIEASRDWIIEKSINQLDSISRIHILNISIFYGDITFNEAEEVLDSIERPQYSLRKLHEANLVTVLDDGVVLHDSIREVAYSMLTKDTKHKLHVKMANFHFETMEYQKGSGEGVLYDDIMKWGYHVESLENAKLTNSIYSELLNLSNSELDALWAINRYGYPFDFETKDLSSSEYIVNGLLTSGFIESNTNPERKNFLGRPLRYSLKKIDFWGECFVLYLCKSRGLSGEMGYIPIFKPNHAWDVQARSCWWEHCIEFMPLPPLPKSSYIEHIKFIQEQFDKGAYAEKSEEDQKRLRDIITTGVPEHAVDKPDKKMESERCPIWGHCCPDGKKQAKECTKILKS